eukprot:6076833-Pleurochrysis_carterae.AAC.1
MTSRIVKNTRGDNGCVKKIIKIVRAVDEGDRDIVRLDAFAYKRMTAVDVLGPLVVFRVIR